MIHPKDFFGALQVNNISFFTGVPDSLLKDFCAYIEDHAGPDEHIIAENEGGAVALATGYYLATKKPALVYMQNSGFGNAVNPLLSLVDPKVYSIPQLLVIGWRGEPGIKDEPQHVKQGSVMLGLLKTLEIPFVILDRSTIKIERIVANACRMVQRGSGPFVFLVRKGSFESCSFHKKRDWNYPLNRETAIKVILRDLDSNDIVVATTGMTSRELFECRETLHQGHQNDFLTVGSMGHCSQIALGIALERRNRNIYCLDGDGSVLMHMGGLATVGSKSPANFRHILINNAAHESVGGQPTAGRYVDFPRIAKACRYRLALQAQTEAEIIKAMKIFKANAGPSLLEVRVSQGARKNLGRPTESPKESKRQLMRSLSY